MVRIMLKLENEGAEEGEESAEWDEKDEPLMLLDHHFLWAGESKPPQIYCVLQFSCVMLSEGTDFCWLLRFTSDPSCASHMIYCVPAALRQLRNQPVSFFTTTRCPEVNADILLLNFSYEGISHWSGGRTAAVCRVWDKRTLTFWDKAKQISTSRGKRFHHNNLCDFLLKAIALTTAGRTASVPLQKYLILFSYSLECGG